MSEPLGQIEEEIQRARREGGGSALRRALARGLRRLRALDPPGARAVVADDEELNRLLAGGAGPAELAARLGELAAARRCLGCGTCCRASSPTLYLEDRELVGPGGLEFEMLYTLRAGELGYSARLGRSLVIEQDLLKLRERPGAGCILLAGNRCTRYQSRPLQCRWLRCWEERHAGQLEGRPRLDRRLLLADDPTALALMDEYDAKLPAAELARLFTAAAAGDRQAAGQALALVELDHRLRAAVGERYGYGPERLLLMWGRPALEVARGHGLALELDAAGEPRLVPRGVGGRK